MSNRTNQPTQYNLARIAGALYLVIIVAGIFAEMAVRSSLIVPNDAAATAENIMASESLFRLGILSDFIMVISDVAVGLIFYVMFKSVNQSLSLLASFFRLAQATVIGINLLNLLFALELLSGADYLGAFTPDQSESLAMVFLNAHAVGYRIALVFFGLSIAILGYLIYKSETFPRLLGIGLIIAAVGYLTDSFANFALTNYADYEDALTGLVVISAVIAEMLLGLWLLFKGERRNKVALNTTQAEVLGA